jgi:cytochrome P450
VLQHVASLAEISWAKPILAYVPHNKAQAAAIKQFMAFSEEKLSQRMQIGGEAEIDVLGFLMTAGKRNPAYKLSTEALGSEARLVIAAGTDTTSIAITYSLPQPTGQ